MDSQESEKVHPNSFTHAIRDLAKKVEAWRKENKHCNQREAALVLTKLEEAEMFSLRMIKNKKD